MVPTAVEDVAAETEYGIRFVCAVAHDNIFATQFHPEKSQGMGLQILKELRRALRCGSTTCRSAKRKGWYSERLGKLCTGSISLSLSFRKLQPLGPEGRRGVHAVAAVLGCSYRICFGFLFPVADLERYSSRCGLCALVRGRCGFDIAGCLGFLDDQSLDLGAVAGISLIVAGVVVLNIFSVTLY